jgi:DNA-directed RNA polymerase I, II, and III subunit RPABC2
MSEAEDDAMKIELLPSKNGATGEQKKKRITTPYMTKYERARVIGTRALQIR